MTLITESHADKIKGTISSYDRVIINGTLTQLCYAGGITKYLYSKGIKIFNYAKEFAEPLQKALRDNAKRIAKDNDIKIEFISKSSIRKENVIKKQLEVRGYHPGLVGIISVIEKCQMYTPYYDKNLNYPELKMKSGKCLHYYYYFIDETLGLCYVRVPTWLPCNLQIYFNGHNWLSNELNKVNISHKMLDNAFTEISNYQKAQEISDSFCGEVIKSLFDSFAEKYCPIVKNLPSEYHWSILQAEYATDIIFEDKKDLQPVYEKIIRTATTAVKVDNIATFLGKKLHGNYQQDMGNHYNKRIKGTRIKHTMGKASIKMYDKFAHILRIETTINDVSFFKHYRAVETKSGIVHKEANMKKNIYSIRALQEKCKAANTRYLKFISTFDDTSSGASKITELSETKKIDNTSYRGFNFFDKEDQKIIQTISCGEFNINGFYNKNIRRHIQDDNMSSGKMTRILKRLRVHGLIKKVGNTRKYYLTDLGKKITTAMAQVKEFIIVPTLSAQM